MSSHDLAAAAGPAAPLSALSDDELVTRARAHDVAAFEELVGRHEEKVYRLAMRFVRNETDAGEIVQETFLAAWRNLETFQGKAQFASWLYRVAQTTLADHWREYYAEDTGELDDDVTRPPAPRENPEAIQRVDALLATLPESYRRVLELRFLRGYSVRETAQALDLSETNVKVLQFRALNRAGRERGRPS